jgi:PIN domain nuclease of toxin-antitoxin system
MMYLLDTKIFIWLIHTQERISPAARSVLSNANQDLNISIVSIWEIGIKVGLNKLSLPEPLEDTIEVQLLTNRIELLPIEFSHAP